MTTLHTVIIASLLHLSTQCSARPLVMDKIDGDNQQSSNPFRDHLEKTISRKDFTPPKQVHFGFKPVKTASDAFPILDIEDLDDLPGPPYDATNDLEDFADIFPDDIGPRQV